jgi:uncharacterized protein YraI
MHTSWTLRVVSGLGALALVAAFGFGGPSGCAAPTGGSSGPSSTELVGADDSGDGTAAESVLGSLAVGSTLKATANVNLRSGPSTSNSIYHVVPTGSIVTVVASDPKNGFYNVKHNGVVGWSFGTYYDLVSGGAPPPSGGGGTPPPPSSGPRDNAIARAKEGVGFSYWWGHGRWLPGGPTSSSKGSCSGSCPSCSHSGNYGADCSGYVGKIWQVPSSNSDVTVDEHPYSTASFVSDTSQWTTVSRGAVQPADALVYNSGGAGHIFLFESGDGWGSMWTYEAKGCSYGIVHDLRTASTAYHAIQRAGF